MKKYLIFVLALMLSGCFVCRNSKVETEDDAARKAAASAEKEPKVKTVYVEKIVKVKEKAEPIATYSATNHPFFVSGTSALTKDGLENMKYLAKEVKKYPDAMFVLVGHTDNIGSDEFNQVLSEQRAKSVAKALKDNGINNLMGVDGRGSSEPKASNDTEEGRQKNRRVEVFVRQ